MVWGLKCISHTVNEKNEKTILPRYKRGDSLSPLLLFPQLVCPLLSQNPPTNNITCYQIENQLLNANEELVAIKWLNCYKHSLSLSLSTHTHLHVCTNIYIFMYYTMYQSGYPQCESKWVAHLSICCLKIDNLGQIKKLADLQICVYVFVQHT